MCALKAAADDGWRRGSASALELVERVLLRDDALEDEELGVAFAASGKIEESGGGVVGEGVAFDLDGELDGRS